MKRHYTGDVTGFFGTINLLGPRSLRQRPYDKFWNEHFTHVQLRYCIVDSGTGAPVTVGR